MIKLLIVDDESSISGMSKKQVEHLNYLVITADDGLEALDKVKTYRPDLIILDVLMPKMDGYRRISQTISGRTD